MSHCDDGPLSWVMLRASMGSDMVDNMSDLRLPLGAKSFVFILFLISPNAMV